MQTPDRYWEGLYWDGFDPNAVGAVPLAEQDDEEDHAAVLKDVRYDTRLRNTALVAFGNVWLLNLLDTVLPKRARKSRSISTLSKYSRKNDAMYSCADYGTPMCLLALGTVQPLTLA